MPQQQIEDEGISRSEWKAAAKKVYLDAGDTGAEATELAKYLCDQEDWSSGEVQDPINAAKEDVNGRPNTMKANAFNVILEAVVNAKGDSKKLTDLLEHIYLDHLRLQHLDDVKNDILPFDGPEQKTCPKVDAAWLLRTSNFDADLRTMIDDDIKYWDAQ